MKIALSEIWDFIDFVDKSGTKWQFKLFAGDVTVDKLNATVLKSIRDDRNYDTELLPSIFTFREILWQPDVYTNVKMSLPPLRILKAFCEERLEEFDDKYPQSIYARLINGIGLYCNRSIQLLESEASPPVTRVLGDLRRDCLPIIKFFILHPQNRKDYYQDAINRLNYAVKIQLTQFNNRYTELEDPYWEAIFAKLKQKKSVEADSPVTDTKE